MTKRERIERALNFDSPDRIPYVDSVQQAGLIHLLGVKSGVAISLIGMKNSGGLQITVL